MRGQNFTGATEAELKQGSTTVSCPFSVVSDTTLLVNFCGGFSSGAFDVVVGNDYGESPLDSADQFTITEFTPTSGPVGTRVTISGMHLAVPGVTVFFTAICAATGTPGCSIPATFTINSDGTLSAIVPTGAVTGPIMVVNQVGSATSTQDFTVT